MKRTLLLLSLSCLTVGVSLGSTITGSTSSTNVMFSGFDGGKEKEIDLVGSIVYISDSNGSNLGIDGCVFQPAGTNDSSCLTSTFTVTLTPTNSETGSATWTITNIGTTNILSLTFDLQPGNSIFHPCGVAGAITQGGNCGVSGSGSSVDTVSAGSAISASVVYNNLATDLTPKKPSSPLYYEVTFNWGPTVFVPGDTFAFGASSDFFTPLPEPATYGMVGLALAGLGALRIRRRRASKS